jgi:peroxiredoxin Q/BCP
LSGKKAKAARRASPAYRARKQAAQRRGEQRRRWGRLAYWPAVLLVIGGLIAFLALRNNSTSGTPGSAKSASQGSSGYQFAVGAPGPGQAAPAIRLPSTRGGTFDLAAYKGKEPVLLYFQEGLTCQPCWDQIAAIDQERGKFRALGIKTIVSITTDPLDLIKEKAQDEDLEMPILADEDAHVSDTYDARTYSMTWMKPPRDGHSFILIGKDGRIRWRADYGGPPKYTMFLPVDALITDLRSGLG